MYGARQFRLQVAAMPAFLNARYTSNPRFVLGFSLGIVLVLVALFALLAWYVFAREKQSRKAEDQRRKQHSLLVKAAKEAHERTIAYACHQLRCVPAKSCAL